MAVITICSDLRQDGRVAIAIHKFLTHKNELFYT